MGLKKRIDRLEGGTKAGGVLMFYTDPTWSDRRRDEAEAQFRESEGIPQSASTWHLHNNSGNEPHGHYVSEKEFDDLLAHVAKNSGRIGVDRSSKAEVASQPSERRGFHPMRHWDVRHIGSQSGDGTEAAIGGIGAGLLGGL